MLRGYRRAPVTAIWCEQITYTQQPQWPDAGLLGQITAELGALPPLTRAEECNLLRERLASVARGEAFLLQGGDCAEVFDRGSAGQVRAKLETMLQMAGILSRGGSLPVVKIGRVAGQYAKPRSQPTETRNGVTLPSYRGDAVNGRDFSMRARTPDPRRLLRMYHASTASLEVLRGYVPRSPADLVRAAGRPEKHLVSAALGGQSSFCAGDIDVTVRRLGPRRAGTLPLEFFASHEALLLEYENALVRMDDLSGRPYGLSGHMLWIGERTRQLTGPHVDFAARIANPVGIKLGPTATADEVLALIDRIDPDRQPGRVTLITRMGADRIRERLPALVAKVTASGRPVVWVCDPMHGNTIEAPTGHKTRRYESIAEEVHGFLDVHRSLGTHPGGIHLEFTGEHVTECVGGHQNITFEDLPWHYATACDPRLNHGQALQLSREIAGRMY